MRLSLTAASTALFSTWMFVESAVVEAILARATLIDV
jgi:hypothetical protein